MSISSILSMSALITPFKNNKLDLETYEYLIKRQIRLGMHACIPVGTSGESATLSHDEHRECIALATSVCKKEGAKVIAGAGSNSTSEAIGLAKFAQSVGADGILCVCPYYNRPTQEGLYQHYKAIAMSVSIPVILYHVPARVGVDIEVATFVRLFNEVDNIAGIKEACGSVERIVEFSVKASKAMIYSGEDAINYPLLSAVPRGHGGVISVTGNLLPDKISSLVELIRDGKFDEARELNMSLLELNKVLFIESNPIPIKTAMYLSGLIPSLEFRLPLCNLSTDHRKTLEKTLEKYEVKK